MAISGASESAFGGNKTGRRFRLSGITRRWMTNTVLLVAVIVSAGVGSFIAAYAGYCVRGMSTGLRAKANTAAEFFTSYITRTYAEYYDSACRYTESFEDADRLELQFVSTAGYVETSSSGAAAGTPAGTPDVLQAVQSLETAAWRGKNPDTGERVLSVSVPLVYGDGQVIGVMRYLTGLRLVNRQIASTAALAVFTGLAVLTLVGLGSLYFIRSVVSPLQEVTHMVRRIADGSYGVQIQKPYRDEIGELVDSINDMSIRVSQSEKAQTDFVSSVSHELRTPLTAITGWAETISYDETLSEDALRGVGIIQREAKRLTGMVEELLEFTRMQDGRFTLNVEQVDVAAELEDAVFTYRELLTQEGMTLEYVPPEEDLPMISGDPERLKQVFLNLMDNARKYARSGKRIRVGVEQEGKWLLVTVRDFGPGVPEDDLENVKKKFFKGSSKERGSGIGLAVCDEIVQYHGGRLVLQNAEGGGLKVTVQLPLSLEETA